MAARIAERIENTSRRLLDNLQDPVAAVVIQGVQRHVVYPLDRFLAVLESKAIDYNCVASGCFPQVLDILIATDELLSLVNESSSNTAAILSRLHDMICRSTAQKSLSDVLGAIWSDAIAIYSQQLCHWLLNGEPPQNTMDFFVVEKLCDDNCASSGPEFRISDANRPSFIDNKSAENFLAAGSIIRRIRQHEHDQITASHQTRRLRTNTSLKRESYSTLVKKSFPKVLASAPKSSLGIEAASFQLRNFASDCLTELVSFGELKEFLNTQRKYVLLGDERFWFSFLRKLHQANQCSRSPSQPSDIHTHDRPLSRILDELSLEDDSAPSLSHMLQLSVDANEDVVATCMPSPLTITTGSNSESYCRLFAITFKVRRVLNDLRFCSHVFTTARTHGDLARSKLNRRTITPSLTRLLRIRWRMIHFIQGLDDYLQVDAIQTGFEILMSVVNGGTIDGNRNEQAHYEDILRTHADILAAWIHRSMLNVDSILRRINDICTVCTKFCAQINNGLLRENRHDTELMYAERNFLNNAGLLVTLLANLSSRSGTQHVSVLLLRLDFNGYYINSGASLPHNRADQTQMRNSVLQ